jgi:hypothetical protein
MIFFFLFLFPAEFDFGNADPEGAKNLAGGKVLRLIQVRLAMPSFEKISPTCQDNSPQAGIAHSSSVNTVSFSSCTTKRFPLSRCASATKNQLPVRTRLTEIAQGSRLLFIAELLKSGIRAQRIPEWIES